MLGSGETPCHRRGVIGAAGRASRGGRLRPDGPISSRGAGLRGCSAPPRRRLRLGWRGCCASGRGCAPGMKGRLRPGMRRCRGVGAYVPGGGCARGEEGRLRRGQPRPHPGSAASAPILCPEEEAFARGCGCVPGIRLRPGMRMRPPGRDCAEVGPASAVSPRDAPLRGEDRGPPERARRVRGEAARSEGTVSAGCPAPRAPRWGSSRRRRAPGALQNDLGRLGARGDF